MFKFTSCPEESNPESPKTPPQTKIKKEVPPAPTKKDAAPKQLTHDLTLTGGSRELKFSTDPSSPQDPSVIFPPPTIP